MNNKKAFTLIEMLIVIIIIGILAAALIPQLTWIQARARDTARSGHMRDISNALETYHIDNNSYPIANYTISYSPYKLDRKNILIPTLYAQSSISNIDSSLWSYLKSIPLDPSGKGIAANNDWSCIDIWNSYAYYTDATGSIYAITSFKESKKGNANACGDTIDRDGDGNFEKIGAGLITNINNSPNEWWEEENQSQNMNISIFRRWDTRSNIEIYIWENQTTPYTTATFTHQNTTTLSIASQNMSNIYFKMPQDINFIAWSYNDENGGSSINIPGADYSNEYWGSYRISNIILDGSNGYNINLNMRWNGM
jgi:prepilin-type N-terminal cleavage/methylation domain-containing protein